MESGDIEKLVSTRTSELLARSQTHAWASLAAVWARVFVLATAAWVKWPDLLVAVEQAFPAALRRSVGLDLHIDHAQQVEGLEGFDVGDDGSSEWQHAIDVTAMLLDALRGQDVAVCLRNALQGHLEGMFNVLSNEMSDAAGQPISQYEASLRVPEDWRWFQTVNFVKSL